MEEPLLSGDNSEVRDQEIPIATSNWNYRWKIFQSSLNLVVHTLMGAVVGIALIFALKNGLPLKSTPLHIILCVIGYQFLTANAILSLSPHNGWSNRFRLVDKRRAHWILQISGSALALAGSLVKILDKPVHWNTFHGQFALVALVFTGLSLLNGLTSLWSYEIRRYIPANLSKITHICFGTVSFAAAAVTLCLGFDKHSFRSWASDPIAYTVIVFTGVLTFIVTMNPLITFYMKSRCVIRNRIDGV